MARGRGWSLKGRGYRGSRRGLVLNSELPTVGDDYLFGGFAAAGSVRLHLLHHFHPVHHGAEHDVLPVQPCSFDRAQEELGPVGVGPGVGHGQGAGAGVLQGEVLVGELVAIDGFSTGSVVVGEVAAL